MPITVARLSELTKQLTGGKYGEYLGAAASGVIDGLLIEMEQGTIWIVKNVIGAVLPFLFKGGGGVVEGFAKHSVGNAAMILVLSIGKRMEQSEGGGS